MGSRVASAESESREESPASSPSVAPGDRLRVAFCVGSLNVGGTELNAVRTAERLDRTRYELCVISLQRDGPLAERYRAAGVPVHHFPLASLYGPSAAREGVRVFRFLRSQRIDILHAHDKYANIFAAPWARAAGVRLITSRRWWAGEPRWGHRLLNAWSYRLSDVVLANSERVGELVATREGIRRDRIVVVPNFVDADAFRPPTEELVGRLRGSLGIPADARLIGNIANLRPVKDQESLLRAAALLAARWPDVRVVLVGDGESRTALESLARELGIAGRVHFAGRQPNEPNLHHLFEISVLSSMSEGLSNSILEAMAAARPVVATDVGATADAVLEGQTGLLVPRRMPDRLASALDTLLADPVRGRRMGEAGQASARARYSPEGALARLTSLYEGLSDPAVLRR
jgi:L-malate glycosyltransferase